MVVSGANGQIIGTGLQNSLDILEQNCTTENGGISAAQATLEFESDGYSDWFLPSQDELAELYINLVQDSVNINSYNFTNNWYWSSFYESYNEGFGYPNMVGFFYYQYNLNIEPANVSDFSKVRPIRAFGNWTMGCMDSLACNYNPEANMADGSCDYPEQGYDCDGNITAEIGDVIEGGYLFYIDETGQRGLVASMDDIGQLFWGCYYENVGSDLFGADGTGIGEGLQNTIDILASCSDSPIAAREVFNFNYLDFSDWYLPSKDELVEMYNAIGNGSQQGNFGSFMNDWYWSSSEHDEDDVWSVNFTDGNTLIHYKPYTLNVRPIRAFGNWIEGCLDESACNYNSEVNFPNSTLCEYPQFGYDCDGNITEYIVGMEAEGGIVFYVDETGQHGLVAATEDLEGTYEWGCYGEYIDGADGESIGAGYQNTLDIVADCSETSIAASEALAYESEGFYDWYLPSINELEEMYSTIGNGGSEGNIGGFINEYYWSSSEYNTHDAWYVNFGNGYKGSSNNYYTVKVRVIRSF